MNPRYDNPEIKSFRDIVAWQKAYALGLTLYRVTATFPEQEKFSLSMQLRRGGVSVASNIAEGYGRGGQGNYVRFLKIARGALYEIETQISFAVDLAYLAPDVATRLKFQVDECSRVLGGLIRSNETDHRS